jgi:hypothetical protein
MYACMYACMCMCVRYTFVYVSCTYTFVYVSCTCTMHTAHIHIYKHIHIHTYGYTYINACTVRPYCTKRGQKKNGAALRQNGSCSFTCWGAWASPCCSRHPVTAKDLAAGQQIQRLSLLHVSRLPDDLTRHRLNRVHLYTWWRLA